MTAMSPSSSYCDGSVVEAPQQSESGGLVVRVALALAPEDSGQEWGERAAVR